MKKRYVVRLSAEEREELTSLVETGKQAQYPPLAREVFDWPPRGRGWSRRG